MIQLLFWNIATVKKSSRGGCLQIERLTVSLTILFPTAHALLRSFLDDFHDDRLKNRLVENRL